MNKKNDLVYRLIFKLTNVEIKNFKKFINFYFSKPESTLEFLNIVLKNIKKEDIFSEKKMKALLPESLSFSKQKHSLKKCLMSYLKFLKLDEKEPDSATEFTDSILETEVLIEKDEVPEAMDFVTGMIEKNEIHIKPSYLQIYLETLFYYRPVVRSLKNDLDYHKDLNKKIESNINDILKYNEVFLTRRLLHIKIVDKKKEGLESFHKKLINLNNNITNIPTKLNINSAYYFYFLLKKDKDNLAKTLLEKCEIVQDGFLAKKYMFEGFSGVRLIIMGSIDFKQIILTI